MYVHFGSEGVFRSILEKIGARMGTASKLEAPGRIEHSNKERVWKPAIHRVGPTEALGAAPDFEAVPSRLSKLCNNMT
jgi:hypothetical protein